MVNVRDDTTVTNSVVHWIIRIELNDAIWIIIEPIYHQFYIKKTKKKKDYNAIA